MNDRRHKCSKNEHNIVNHLYFRKKIQLGIRYRAPISPALPALCVYISNSSDPIRSYFLPTQSRPQSHTNSLSSGVAWAALGRVRHRFTNGSGTGFAGNGCHFLWVSWFFSMLALSFPAAFIEFRGICLAPRPLCNPTPCGYYGFPLSTCLECTGAFLMPKLQHGQWWSVW